MFLWLTFCTSRNKVFYLYWHKVPLPVFTTKQKRGFSNWKKAKQRFFENEPSQSHKHALHSHEMLLNGSVPSAVLSQLREDQDENQNMLKKLLSSLKSLLQQGMSIRGHTEEEGNLNYQVLKCRSEGVPGLESWLKSGDCTGHMILSTNWLSCCIYATLEEATLGNWDCWMGFNYCE